MTLNQMTYKQGQALAKFIHELRPDWDTPGIEDALGRARDMAPAPDLAIAATRAAATATNRTPAVIALQGAHWRASDGAKPQTRYNPDETCTTCGYSKFVCRSRWSDDHEFESVNDQRRRLEEQHFAIDDAKRQAKLAALLADKQAESAATDIV